MGKVDLAGKLSDARARVEADAPIEDRGLAKFARLTRKDARVRADQDAALTALARTLMRRRPVKTERITENTLIRVAIDLLLAHADQLRGSTEDELRDSATAVVPKSRTSELPDSRSSDLSDSGTSDVRASRTSEHPDTRGAGEPRFGVTAFPDSGSSVAARSPHPGRREITVSDARRLASDPSTVSAPSMQSQAMGR